MSTDGDGLGSLVGRFYQEELAEHARERNTILAVDTGTGKTLIAALVIRWKLAMDRMDPTDGSTPVKKVAMFLVPKVPLVEQQRKVMEGNTSLTVRGYTGAMGVDFWDRTAWQKEFNASDILVMTPQIFLNVLRHAHWTMNQVSMIVFDEVHNCKGRSPEAQIMTDHYHTQPLNARPKILGLTASPIFNHKNPITALQQMERLTDCKVIVVKHNMGELSKFTFQAKDRIVDYPSSPSVWPLYANSENPSLWSDLHKRKLLPNDLLFPRKNYKSDLPNSEWYRAFAERYRSTVQALGPFAADLFVLVHISTGLEGVRNDLQPLYPDTPDKDAKRRQSMNDTMDVLLAHQPRLASEGDELKHEWLSPKLLALKELLLEQKDVPEFRGIIFCYERQFATTLALLLPRLGVPGIRAGPLVGHGQNACSEPTKIGMRGMAFRAQEHIVEDFRNGSLNFLIATSVAEEGLDFPLCSFVCRFDPPRTLPQYIQSRGRARKEGSTFIIMLEVGPSLDRGRLEQLQLGEIRLKKMYGRNMDKLDDEDNSNDYYEDEDAFEGRFTVEKTGASITPGGCIALIENLCSLIPVDLHTRPLRPKYTIRAVTPLQDFNCEVLLPAALPIPREHLLIKSDPTVRSKKAAKRSAAFNAVQILFRLGVFDDYLLPMRREKGDIAEDVDGKPPIDVTGIEPMMEVLVNDAWGDVRCEGAQVYVHRLSAAGQTGMGLVCASRLEPFEGYMTASRSEIYIQVSTGVAMEILDEQSKVIDLMEEYTKRGIRYSVTRKGLEKKHLSMFLVPLDDNGHPDLEEMEHCVHTPASQDWRAVDVSGATPVLVSTTQYSKVSKLVCTRPDLKAADCIASSPYLTKLVKNMIKWSSVNVPEDDIVLECRELMQTTSTDFREPTRQKATVLAESSIFLPQSLCQWVNFNQKSVSWYMLLPPLANLLQSVYRARAAQKMLQAPLALDRTIEAFTLPSANSSFSNQRLETLGDAFLKLATSIHVFNKFPYKHEGQLTVLKMNSISNRYLLGRGHVRNLIGFMNIEPNSQARWRLITDFTKLVDGSWVVERKVPRRSVQDCMEALLGVGWLSGGVKGGLEVGTKLDLCFGGTEEWYNRYPSVEVHGGTPFSGLEQALGYQFRNQNLVAEALTHPSFAKGGPSYQRLEFLGDAVLDLVILDHFFKKFPEAGPGKLSRARARCVCAQTLSAIATKKLDIHKIIFADSVSLVQDMIKTADNVFGTMSFAEIIDSIWKLEVPKALSDVVEALLGAVLIDSGWSYDAVSGVVMHLFNDVLDYVHPDMPADPATEFMLWVARYGCTQVKYKRCSSSEEVAPRKDHVFVVVHDVDIGPPSKIEPKKTAVLARASASIQARQLLSDPNSEFAFDKLCTCTKRQKLEHAKLHQAAADLVSDEADLDPETTEGFAIDAQIHLTKMGENDVEAEVEDEDEDSGEDEVL